MSDEQWANHPVSQAAVAAYEEALARAEKAEARLEQVVNSIQDVYVEGWGHGAITHGNRNLAAIREAALQDWQNSGARRLIAHEGESDD